MRKILLIVLSFVVLIAVIVILPSVISKKSLEDQQAAVLKSGILSSTKQTVDTVVSPIKTEEISNNSKAQEVVSEQKIPSIIENEQGLSQKNIYITEKLSKASVSLSQVRLLQETLKYIGLYTGSIRGVFDTNTENAVKKFQISRGMNPDGVIGEKSRDLLNEIIWGKNPTGGAYINLSGPQRSKDPIIPKCDTNSAQSITVTSPNGGNTYWAGGNITIQWIDCNIDVSQIKVELLKYNDGTVLNTITSTNDGIENFTIPISATHGLYYRARVTLISNNTVTDMSDNLFTIQNNCNAKIEHDPISLGGVVDISNNGLINTPRAITGSNGDIYGSYGWTTSQNLVPIMKFKITAINCNLNLKDIKFSQHNLFQVNPDVQPEGNELYGVDRITYPSNGNENPNTFSDWMGNNHAGFRNYTNTGLFNDFALFVDSVQVSQSSRVPHWFNQEVDDNGLGQFYYSTNLLSAFCNGNTSGLVTVLVCPTNALLNINVTFLADLIMAELDQIISQIQDANPDEVYALGFMNFGANGYTIPYGQSRTFIMKARPAMVVLKWKDADSCDAGVGGHDYFNLDDLGHNTDGGFYFYCPVYPNTNPIPNIVENKNIVLRIDSITAQNVLGSPVGFNSNDNWHSGTGGLPLYSSIKEIRE